MENINNGDFEKFVRENLEGLDDSAQENLWANIAARQKRSNMWLKTRYYGKIVLPVLAIAAASVWGITRLLPQHSELAKSLTPMSPLQSEQTSLFTEVLPSDSTAAALAPVPGGEMPVVVQAPGTVKVNHFPKWYRQNDVPVANTRFDASTGILFQNPESGNAVTIPANSLVYANGQPVTGAVDLFFREYRDIPDMLSADIPMHFTDERGTFFFNTGGMFDVRVSQNGQELFMAPGQAYTVNFTATDNLSNASLFYLNEKKNDWEYVSNQPFATNVSNIQFDMRNPEMLGGQPPVSTETTVIRENTDGNAEKCLPQSPDFANVETGIEWVKEAIATGIDLTTGKRKLPVWYLKNPTAVDQYFTYSFDRSDLKLVYANDEGTRFFPQDLHGVFTELNAFKDCYFIRTGDSLATYTPQSVNAIFSRTNAWKSCTVRQEGPDPASCLMTLGTEKEGFIQLNARLVRINESGINAALDANKVFRRYEEMREERLNGLLKELNMLRRFTETSKMFREEAEFCLEEKEWLRYFEKNLPAMRARYLKLEQNGMTSNNPAIRDAILAWSNNARTLRLERADQIAASLSVGKQLGAVLSLTGFGAFNCDQIYQFIRQPMFSAVKFTSETGKAVKATQLRMLDKATKMFLTMKSADQLMRLPGRKMELVVTDDEGRLYHLSGADYDRIVSKEYNLYKISLKDVTDSVQSPSGWADLLGI